MGQCPHLGSKYYNKFRSNFKYHFFPGSHCVLWTRGASTGARSVLTGAPGSAGVSTIPTPKKSRLLALLLISTTHVPDHEPSLARVRQQSREGSHPSRHCGSPKPCAFSPHMVR